MAEHSDLIDDIRKASRQLVRELGFMGGDFACTDLPPSAVHALIEIDACAGIMARDLGAVLRLEKSSVSRMLRKLVVSGDVCERPDHSDSRSKRLYLTDKGRKRVEAIHGFARQQVADALSRTVAQDGPRILEGLRVYAGALAGRAISSGADIAIVEGYRPGLIATVTRMHALYYARTVGFGQRFETVVAGGLASFCDRLQRPGNAIWLALRGDDILGSVAIDGEDLGPGRAHLRWFIVDDGLRGGGVGRRLLAAALAFVDERDFAQTHLWTFSGLAAARHLYESYGFHCEEERLGNQWGKDVIEQRFVRPRPS